MDFTNNDLGGYSSNNYANELDNSSTIKVETLRSLSLNKTDSVEEKISIALSNIDLIERCLATKSDKFLSKGELKNYGMLALRTAALEVDEKEDFRAFALKRIEFMMNRAIAEAHLILENKENNCDNNSLGNRFDTIQNTYCYQ